MFEGMPFSLRAWRAEATISACAEFWTSAAGGGGDWDLDMVNHVVGGKAAQRKVTVNPRDVR